VPTPTPESFAALARSSPWRWSTLRFSVSWPGDRYRPEGLRAWLRRPDLLRVETVGGEFRQVVREPRATAAVISFPPTAETHRTYPWPAEAALPVRRPDGLVAVRPRRVSYDAPMYRDYSWVAMLDPVELADGAGPDIDDAPLRTGEVREVEHAGRLAWEAEVEPLPPYEPRCGCCPLLRSREVDLAEYGPEGAQLRESYPDAFRVRLDVGTGVCALTEEIGGPTPGRGHDLRIEAVDERMPDHLFSRR
jgi:hypothetical protein